MAVIAAYDAHADWYEDNLSRPNAVAYTRRVCDTLRSLLGTGTGACLDVCCGTGVHAPVIRELGWNPVGDATALPVAGRSVPAATSVLAHTDVPDYAAVLHEVARVLRMARAARRPAQRGDCGRTVHRAHR